MALVILTLVAALAIEVTISARRNAATAAETERATELLIRFLNAPMVSTGTQSGRTDGFSWRMTVSPDPATSVPKICARSIELTAERTRRRYGAMSQVPCPSPRSAS